MTSKKARILIALVILGMIATRLVWMQLRRYPVHSSVCAIAALELINLQEPGSCQVDDVLRAYGQAFTDRRSYCNSVSTVFYSAFLERSCRGGTFRPQVTIADQEVLLGFTILFCVLIARFLTHSWLIAMATGAILLSRGRFLASLGDISSHNLSAMLFALWSALITHFVRTGSLLTFVLSFIAALPLTLLNGMFITLFWAFPCVSLLCFALQRPLVASRVNELKADVRLKLRQRSLRTYLVPAVTREVPDFWQRFRSFLGFESSGEERGYRRLRDQFQRGHYLRPLQVSFVLWVAFRELLWRLLAVTTIIAMIATAGFAYLYSQDWIYRGGSALLGVWERYKYCLTYTWSHWRREAQEPIDVDVFVALSFLVLSVTFIRKRSFLGLWEVGFTYLNLLVLTCVTGIALDAYDAMLLPQLSPVILDRYFTESSRASQVILVTEPVLLALGIVSIVNFFRYVDGLLVRHRRS